ncbi:MAG TPA: BON domain-containing protein [Thermoanaerobaculia bacterium]|nr:BON domain-containing protein [Thermoanaerobaculia bacterium]
MNKDRLTLLGSAGLGAGLGAGLMYLLDPQGGRQRRALAKDKCVHAAKTSGKAMSKASRDLGNRTKGLIAGAGSRLHRGDVDDLVLADRVRSKMGRVVSDPSAIIVTSYEGRVTLSGTVPASEAGKLLPKVQKVKGVKGVDNHLYLLGTEGDASSVQEGRASFLRRNRVGAALGAAGLGLLASLRRGKDAGNGTGVADLQNEPAASSELASHGDSLHHNDLLAHDRSLESPALQEDPLQPVLS